MPKKKCTRSHPIPAWMSPSPVEPPKIDPEEIEKAVDRFLGLGWEDESDEYDTPTEPTIDHCLPYLDRYLRVTTLRWKTEEEVKRHIGLLFWYLLKHERPVSKAEIDNLFDNQNLTVKALRNYLSTLKGVLERVAFPWYWKWDFRSRKLVRRDW